MMYCVVFFFKQNTAYEMRISDWSSDVCSSYLIIAVTPDVGVVAVGVAVTLGQLAGSVAADSWSLGPGGKRALSLFRLAGIAVAVVAVMVGAFGRFEVGHLLVIVVVVAAGAIIAIQQAANAWLIVATDRKSVVWGKSVSVRLEFGGRVFLKK